jgi:uncharacterized phage protein gp47/JayE
MPINFSQYVSLVPFDSSPTAIYLDSIDYARVALPEFQPRQGTPEDAILQAVAYISGLNIGAINRLPDRLMAGLVGMMGVILDDGSKTVADIKFTASTTDGATIPQGTVVRYEYEFLGERDAIYFETSEELIIAAVGEEEPLPFDTVEALSLQIGQTIPLAIGTILEIETPTTDILQAELDLIVTAGTNPENENEYLTRSVNYLGSLSSSFAKASQVDSFIASGYGNIVSRSKTYDLTDPDGTLELSDPDEVGFVTIFIYGIGDVVSPEQKTDLLITIQERTVAGLEIGINDVNLVALDVTASITYSAEYEPSVIENNIKSALSSYFSPENYRFTDGIKLSEFYGIISNVRGVVYLTGLTATPQSATYGINDVDGNVEYIYKGSLPSIAFDDIVLTLNSVTL